MTDPGLAEAIAMSFHERYEALAPGHGWETQERSQVAWHELPEANRSLMVAVVSELLTDGVIAAPPPLSVAERSTQAQAELLRESDRERTKEREARRIADDLVRGVAIVSDDADWLRGLLTSAAKMGYESAAPPALSDVEEAKRIAEKWLTHGALSNDAFPELRLLSRVYLALLSDWSARESKLRDVAEQALAVLETERLATGVDEWDEADPRALLYNDVWMILGEEEAGALCAALKPAKSDLDTPAWRESDDDG